MASSFLMFVFTICNGMYINPATIIPVIDLRQNEEMIVSKLYSAATVYGFFYLIGHNISTHQKQELLSESVNFFNLNDSIKHSLQYITGQTFGYTPFESETLNRTLSHFGDTKESFYLCDDSINFDDNIGWSSKNVWPSKDILPKFRQVTTAYFDLMRNLGHKLNEYVALSLNLSKDYFNNDQIFGFEALSALRLIHYLPIVSDEQIGRFGAGQHTDFGFLTFLVTDKNEGLQIYDEQNKQWLDVHGDVFGQEQKNETVIIVNIGDELQMSTNDRFLSTKHRVIIKQPKDRYSAAFFWEPNLDFVVECVETICGNINDDSSLELPKYEPISHRDHLTKKFNAAYGKIDNIKHEL